MPTGGVVAAVLCAFSQETRSFPTTAAAQPQWRGARKTSEDTQRDQLAGTQQP